MIWSGTLLQAALHLTSEHGCTHNLTRTLENTTCLGQPDQEIEASTAMVKLASN